MDVSVGALEVADRLASGVESWAWKARDEGKWCVDCVQLVYVMIAFVVMGWHDDLIRGATQLDDSLTTNVVAAAFVVEDLSLSCVMERVAILYKELKLCQDSSMCLLD